MEVEEGEYKPTTLTKNDDVYDDDDPPLLSSQALEALKEFLAEQSNALTGTTTTADDDGDSGVSLVTEDWRLSQFWYDRETAETVAKEVLSLREDDNSRVACIACPTLYAYLKVADGSFDELRGLMGFSRKVQGTTYASNHKMHKINPDASAQLLEYDKRFEEYGSNFTFYDYNVPEELPSALKHAYQIIVADPPYLSKECLEKVTRTISFLARPGQFYVLLLTGDVQKDRAAELLGLHPCGFRPQHSSKLGNEFRLFTNYDPGKRLGGWEREE